MAKSKQVASVHILSTTKGIMVQLPEMEEFSPAYSRRQVKSIIADLQSVLDDDLVATLLPRSRR